MRGCPLFLLGPKIQMAMCPVLYLLLLYVLMQHPRHNLLVQCLCAACHKGICRELQESLARPLCCEYLCKDRGLKSPWQYCPSWTSDPRQENLMGGKSLCLWACGAFKHTCNMLRAHGDI
jgi:hypothetical protein